MVQYQQASSRQIQEPTTSCRFSNLPVFTGFSSFPAFLQSQNASQVQSFDYSEQTQQQQLKPRYSTQRQVDDWLSNVYYPGAAHTLPVSAYHCRYNPYRMYDHNIFSQKHQNYSTVSPYSNGLQLQNQISPQQSKMAVAKNQISPYHMQQSPPQTNIPPLQKQTTPQFSISPTSSGCSTSPSDLNLQAVQFNWMKTINSDKPRGPHRTRTKDTYRVVYSDFQRLELEKEFCSNKFITLRRKTEIGAMLDLSDRQVKIWFQNRRAKERRQRKDLMTPKERDSIDDENKTEQENNTPTNQSSVKSPRNHEDKSAVCSSSRDPSSAVLSVGVGCPDLFPIPTELPWEDLNHSDSDSSPLYIL